MNIHDFANQHCQPRQGKEHALGADKITQLLQLLPGWELSADGHAIAKDFRFPDFRTSPPSAVHPGNAVRSKHISLRNPRKISVHPLARRAYG